MAFDLSIAACCGESGGPSGCRASKGQQEVQRVVLGAQLQAVIVVHLLNNFVRLLYSFVGF